MSSCDGASFRILEGMVDFRRLPMSIWAGLSRFAHTGVVRQCRRASWQSAPDCLHLLSIDFTVLTLRSMNPFPCGLRGDDVTWSKVQLRANSR